MVSDVRFNRRGLGAGVLLAALVLSQVGVASAEAADVPVDIHFTDPTTVTLEYGEYWGFSLASDADFYFNIYNGGHYTTPMTGVPGGFAPVLSLYSSGGAAQGSLSAPYDVAPLKVGSYTFKVDGSYDDGFDTYHGATPTAAQLTVQPAQLGIELRVLADANNPAAAIVSARFTGRFVDEYQSSFYDSAAISPAGEWHITLTDGDGAVAVERNLERAAGDDVLATSFYWTEAKPDTEYSATAEFTPTGASASNFHIGSATTFAYTAPANPRPVPSSTATARPTADLPDATGFGLPLWALIAILALIVGLGVLVTILSVRLSKRPAAHGTGAVAL
jgi:hypothetical protein